MLIDRYFETVDSLFTKLKETQRGNCLEAGKLMADAVACGNAVNVFDTGHIIDSELVYRGGGAVFLKQFKYSLTVDNPVRPRDRSKVEKSMEGLADYALRASGAMPGDVIIIGSVSGKAVNTIDLALGAREFGMKVIAVTSLEYSSKIQSLHSSGKRLFECADVTLDNCAPAAEAMMQIEGLDARFAAASGLSSVFLLWSSLAVAIEELIKKGIMPSLYKSGNFEDGQEYNEKMIARYTETGW